MYRYKSWTTKKVECQRVDAFELWYWKRLLRVSWTAMRSNQSILKEINLEHSLEGLMLKQKFQYFGHLMQRADSLEKTLMLGKTEGKRRCATEDEMVGRHHWLNRREFELRHRNQRSNYQHMVVGGGKKKITNIRWIIKKARELKKNSYFCFTDYTKTVTCVYTQD